MRPGGGEEVPVGDPQREQAGRRERVHQRRQEGQFFLSFTFTRQEGQFFLSFTFTRRKDWFFCSAELFLEQRDIQSS